MALPVGNLTSGFLCSGGALRQSLNGKPVRAFTSLHSEQRQFSRIEATFRVSRRSSVSSRRRNSRIAAAAGGEIPEEILEDDKFVPLKEDDPRYGPAVLFLLGFGNNEAGRVQEMLQEMEGDDFLRIVLCTPEMIKGTLGQAVRTQQPDLKSVRVAKNLPAMCFLSGLTGEEIMLLIQAFREFGFNDTVFAAHVPKNTDKSLEELIEEVMGDHERLTKSGPLADIEVRIFPDFGHGRE
ncbi:hypothetical protein R1sor_014757 [Riccia sorocarpa]|uniref:Uncharacterized protein n=1 Tax=Riccia sorocarpa TaxID=122646 RepID=A0ABD3HAS3_9MARC